MADMKLIDGWRWNERDGVHDGYTCDAEHWEVHQGCAPVFAGAALPQVAVEKNAECSEYNARDELARYLASMIAPHYLPGGHGTLGEGWGDCTDIADHLLANPAVVLRALGALPSEPFPTGSVQWTLVIPAKETCDRTKESRLSPVPHDYEVVGEEYGSLGDGGSYEELRCRGCGRVAYSAMAD